ncbi:MAG: hypothetical protein FWH47_07290 [Methanomassiliicoccaceae archaeon]|nr:hypothetical protein [Methanomassiliicoccaceae archaeon]
MDTPDGTDEPEAAGPGDDGVRDNSEMDDLKKEMRVAMYASFANGEPIGDKFADYCKRINALMGRTGDEQGQRERDSPDGVLPDQVD